jgi:hypothetical protein
MNNCFLPEQMVDDDDDWWQNVSLLGVDVGYSKKKKTTGIAIYKDGHFIEPRCVGSSCAARREAIEKYAPFDEIAVDGPILPPEAPQNSRRLCEYSLVGGLFAKRCKPGLSHHGEGLKLRQAAASVVGYEFLSRKSLASPLIIEAFPNGFLGVLIEGDAYEKFGKVPRGRKSDVFYCYAAVMGKFDTLLEILSWHDKSVIEGLKREATNDSRAGHERRSALICLLTAACALAGKCQLIGDEFGGAICLPPEAIWQPWAIESLAVRQSSMKTHRHFKPAPPY